MLVFSSQQLHYKWSQPISLHKIASELYMQSFNYGMRIYYIHANCLSPQRPNFMYKQYHLCIYLGKKLRMSIQLKRTGSRSIIRQHSNIVIVHQHFRLGKTNIVILQRHFPQWSTIPLRRLMAKEIRNLKMM